jgi:hypothetical protein
MVLAPRVQCYVGASPHEDTNDASGSGFAAATATGGQLSASRLKEVVETGK